LPHIVVWIIQGSPYNTCSSARDTDTENLVLPSYHHLTGDRCPRWRVRHARRGAPGRWANPQPPPNATIGRTWPVAVVTQDTGARVPLHVLGNGQTSTSRARGAPGGGCGTPVAVPRGGGRGAL